MIIFGAVSCLLKPFTMTSLNYGGNETEDAFNDAYNNPIPNDMDRFSKIVFYGMTLLSSLLYRDQLYSEENLGLQYPNCECYQDPILSSLEKVIEDHKVRSEKAKTLLLSLGVVHETLHKGESIADVTQETLRLLAEYDAPIVKVRDVQEKLQKAFLSYSHNIPK